MNKSSANVIPKVLLLLLFLNEKIKKLKEMIRFLYGALGSIYILTNYNIHWEIKLYERKKEKLLVFAQSLLTKL